MGHATWGWTGDEGRHAGVVVPYGGRGNGTPYLGHGLRQPNSVPEFGASVRVVVRCGGR